MTADRINQPLLGFPLSVKEYGTYNRGRGRLVLPSIAVAVARETQSLTIQIDNTTQGKSFKVRVKGLELTDVTGSYGSELLVSTYSRPITDHLVSWNISPLYYILANISMAQWGT